MIVGGGALLIFFDRARLAATFLAMAALVGARRPCRSRPRASRGGTPRCRRWSRRADHFFRRPGAARLLLLLAAYKARRRVRRRHAAPVPRRRRPHPRATSAGCSGRSASSPACSARWPAARWSIGSAGDPSLVAFGLLQARLGRRVRVRWRWAKPGQPRALRPLRRRALRRRHGDRRPLHLHDGLVRARQQRHRLHGSGQRGGDRHGGRVRRVRIQRAGARLLRPLLPGHRAGAAAPLSPCALLFPPAPVPRAGGRGLEGRAMRVAMYAGTFDPITRGHLSVIERAARLFDRLDRRRGGEP